MLHPSAMNDLHPQTKTRCSLCQKPNSQLTCGCCQESLCKGCAHFVSEETFKYLCPLPENLKHSIYCLSCFNQHVEPAQHEYNLVLQKAHDILVFDKSQGKETRFIRRLEKPLKIENATDHQEVTLHLAFLAAQKNYNALVDVDIRAQKVRDGSYQTTAYSATAVPAQVNDRKLMKDRSLWSDPN